MSLLYRSLLSSYWNCIYSAVDFLQIRVYSRGDEERARRARRISHINTWSIGLVGLTFACAMICGCGSSFTLNSVSGALVASPASVSFGAVKVGETSSATISFSNKGASSVQLSQVGVNGKSFSATSEGTLPVSIAPGAAFHVNVQFKPAASGAASGQLVLSGSSIPSGSEAVDLSGNGTDTASTTTGLKALSCANSSIIGSVVDACTVTLGASAPSGGLSVSLTSSSADVKVPASVTVAASQTSANFNATASAVNSTQTVNLTASEGGTSSTLELQLRGDQSTTTAGLKALSCANSSVIGSVVDACTVTLDASAPSGGLSVSLTSSSTDVKVPASVTVAANETSANFNATVSAVNSTQTVNLTASEGGTSSTFGLQLRGDPSTPVSGGGSSSLSVSATTVVFGDVVLNSPATQSVTLTSTGTESVTVSAIAVTGSGFKLQGATAPMTLAPKQTATLNIEFDPTAAGTDQGQLTITSNASNNPSGAVTLTGTGVAHRVELNWNAPANSPVSIEGYRVYRTSGGGSVYQVLNSTLDSTTSYVDGSVESGQTYEYVVKAVDSQGVESPPSNTTSVTIP